MNEIISISNIRSNKTICKTYKAKNVSQVNNQIIANNNSYLKGFSAYSEYFIPFKGDLNEPPTIDLSEIESYNFANNIRLDVDTSYGNERTNIRFAFTPTQEIKSKPGTKDILNYMLESTPEKFSDAAFDNSDNELRMYLGVEYSDNSMRAYADCDHTRSIEALERLKQFTFNPDFSEANLVKAKNKFKEDMAHVKENPSYLAEKELLEGSYEERSRNIDSIMLQDVKDLYSSVLATSEGKIVISLPKPVYRQQKNNIFNILSTGIPTFKTYSGKNYTKALGPIEKDVVYRQDNPSSNKNEINYSRIFVMPNPDSPKEEAVNDILSALLYNYLKYINEEDKTGKSSNCDHVKGMLDISLHFQTYASPFDKIQNKPDNVDGNINMVNSFIQELIEKPVSDDDMYLAKALIKDNLRYTRRDQSSRTWELVNSHTAGNDFLNQYAKEIDNVRAVDVQKAAQKYLTQPSITTITSE